MIETKKAKAGTTTASRASRPRRLVLGKGLLVGDEAAVEVAA